MVGAAILALAVFGCAVAFGCGAAVLIGIRHAVLAARLRRIDGRVCRVLDVAAIKTCEKHALKPQRTKEFYT